MGRGKCTFKQRDLKAALKAAKTSGAAVARVEVRPDGTIMVIMGEPSPAPEPDRKKGRVDQWLKSKNPST